MDQKVIQDREVIMTKEIILTHNRKLHKLIHTHTHTHTHTTIFNEVNYRGIMSNYLNANNTI